MKKKIAFFDFDGTITTKDTMKSFLIFLNGRAQWNNVLRKNFFKLVYYKLGLLPAAEAKQALWKAHFAGIDCIHFNNQCQIFCDQQLPELIKPAALMEMEKLRQNNFEICIVSASAENWIAPWAKALNINVIATKLQLSNQQFTGCIQGANCNGKEKVYRILQSYNLEEYEEIYTYGDSAGDEPMLSLATKKFYRKF